jgi:tripartite-type tricarboxylate transporter receptor subunit TctC
MTHAPRRRSILAAGAAALALPRLARAQGNSGGSWPDRSIRLVVPFTPGGSTDILARVIAPKLSQALGQTVVIENRGGAGGTVGSEVVARAAPDGNTLMMGHIGTLAVNPTLYPRLGYDPVEGFSPVALVANVANVLVVNPQKVQANDVAGFLRLAKERRGQLTYGSGGNGSAAHIAVVAFADATGIELIHVPYRGTGPMLNDLLAGQIDFTMTGGPAVLPQVRQGQLRALGVSSLARMGAAPEIPTIAEGGVAGFEAVQWYGVVAPAGTPRPIIERLNAEINKALADPEVRSRMAPEGADAAPGTPEAFGRLIRSEIDRWGALIRRTGMKAD